MSFYGFCKKIYRIWREGQKRIPESFFRQILRLPATSKKILLISHELSRTGAPLVLLTIAKVLKKNGFSIALISYNDGYLRKEFEQLGVPVCIAYSAKYDQIGINELENFFDVVLANTILTFHSVNFIKNKNKLIWLIHESQEFETKLLDVLSIPHYGCDGVVKVLKDSGKIYTVSEYSKKVFSKYADEVEVIHNGIDDEFDGYSDHKKLTFSFLGRVQKRKAVDVFVDAVLSLPYEYQNSANFIIAGDVSNDYAKQLKKKSKNIIKWVGEIKKKQQLTNFYKNTDILICVSKDDTAPLVVTEAAMHGIPSVISKNVGSDYIIEEGKSGFILPTGDVNALRCLIVKLITNPDIIKNMKPIARESYLRTSTLDVFEKKFLNIVYDKMNLKRKD